ncbi:MAG: hypothetical protein Tsb009_06500 [Planctomycetaceae bacterium]
MPTLHATEFLKDSDAHRPGPMNVLFGTEHHLKRKTFEAFCGMILGGNDDNDISLTKFAGKDVDFKTVADELRTVSMWGDNRLVCIEDADEFVTNHRGHLEGYLKSPAKKSVLVLVVKSWPKNTRLAREVVKQGLSVECNALKGVALIRWLVETCNSAHEKQLSRDSAALIVELAGVDLGLLSQELSKVAAYVGDRSDIRPEDVRAVVGGWTTQTAFAMIDALIAGRLNQSLTFLDELLRAGESPHKIFGAISFSIKRLAVATETARHGTRLNVALIDAGIFRNRVNEAERYLRKRGRKNAERLLEELLRTDYQLKGGSRVSERLALEQLLVRLSGHLDPANGKSKASAGPSR